MRAFPAGLSTGRERVIFPMPKMLWLNSPRFKNAQTKERIVFLGQILEGAAKLQNVLLGDLITHKGDERELMLLGDGNLCPTLQLTESFSGFTAPEAFLVAESPLPASTRLSLPEVGGWILDHFEVARPEISLCPEESTTVAGTHPLQNSKHALRLGQSFAAAGIPSKALEYFSIAARLNPENPTFIPDLPTPLSFPARFNFSPNTK